MVRPDAAALEAEKDRLRTLLRARRAALSPDRARQAGDRIAAHLARSEAFRAAERLGLYAATDGEPSLDAVFEVARGAGKQLTFPKCEEDGRLCFYTVGRIEALEPGRFGLLEPAAGSTRVDLNALQIVLMPSVAIDDRGVRLGRGGGWYDRTFARTDRGAPRLLAIVHAFQRVDRVPSHPHDRAVDGILSEAGLRWIEG